MDTANDAPAYIVGPDEGEAIWHMGCLFEWKAVAGQTGGAFSLFEVTARKGVEPPLHVHTREDEAFYVLEGEVDFQLGEQVRTAGPGSFVYGPRGLPHTFALRSDVARMLIMLSPAGGERMFFELSEPAARRTLQPEPVPEPDYAAAEALDRELGVTYVGPPLAEAPAQTGAE